MASFTEKIPYLVGKANKSGGVTWHWQPSAALVKANWTSIALGSGGELGNPPQPVRDAAKARNDEVETWRAGGARPAAVKRLIRAATVSALIAHYKAAGWPLLSDPTRSIATATRETYSASFDKIEEWGGDLPLTAITPVRVRAFRDGLLSGYGHTVAFNTLSVLRTLFKYARAAGLDSREANPAAEFGLAAPPPRDQIWDEDGGGDMEAFVQGARAIGYPELELAMKLFEHLGQREADMLALQESQWREVKNLPREDHEILAAMDGPDAGKVMGFYVRQGKTRRWVGVPIAGDLRREVEAQIARNRARAVPTTTILVNEASGRPWKKRYFIDRFNAARDWAVEQLGHARLAELQIRDLRRTAVVRMGELNLEDQLIAAVTGHKLGTIKKILEVYMPRTTKMAGRAVVARLADHRQAAEEKARKA